MEAALFSAASLAAWKDASLASIRPENDHKLAVQNKQDI
jgi:hypothetical protein